MRRRRLTGAAVPRVVHVRLLGGSLPPPFLDPTPPLRDDPSPVSQLAPTLGWLVPLGLLIMSIVWVPLEVLDDRGLPRYRALRAELAEVERVNDRLQREVGRLRREVDALRSDPAAVERVARDELGMVRPGELLFQFER